MKRFFYSVKPSYGFTLIETIVAVSIFAVITAFSLGLLNMASKTGTRIMSEAELLENARIGMDVIRAHIMEAYAVELKADPDTGVMSELIATVRKGGAGHEYKFTFNKLLNPGETRYHRLDFGGNELASRISDIIMAIEDDILCMTIITDPAAGADPVVLRASCDLRYKEIK